jgi:asparagine synthetase B (glutamine-hydrolysing)
MIPQINIEKTANELKEKIKSWRGLTVEIAEKLFEARKFYNNQGLRTDLGQNCPKLKTWEMFTNEIGLPKRTANYYLERYIPEENRILDAIEYKEKKEQQHEERIERVKEKTHVKDDYFEKKYQAEEKPEKTAEPKTEKEPVNFDYINNLINEISKSYKKFETLSQGMSGNEDVIALIEARLNNFNSNNRKLEFCNTLIKYLREKAINYNRGE